MHYLWACELCGWGVYPEKGEKANLVHYMKEEAVKHLMKHAQMKAADSGRAVVLMHILEEVLGEK